MEKLALYGGTPVREQPLPPGYKGGLLLGEEEADRTGQVIRGRAPFRYYGMEPQYSVRALENKMAGHLGVPYVLGVSSGTAALIVAMKALGIGSGDKVIIPAVTFLATAGAVVACNAVPVFADADESLNLIPEQLECVYDDEVKAVIAVHIDGVACEMDKIAAFAKKKGIRVIEDTAQSLGTTYLGRQAGTWGDIGTFSFQMQKVLSAGEGGAVATADARWFERAVRYHDQGSFRERERYGIASDDERNAFFGENYRMNELTGAVLAEQWSRLDGIIGAMRRHHRRIKSTLQRELPSLQFRKVPDPAGEGCSMLGLVWESKEKAALFIRAMAAERVKPVLKYGGMPVYMMPLIRHQRTVDPNNYPFSHPFRHPVRYEAGMCPCAEDALKRVTLIPVSPTLTDRDADTIIEAVIKVCRGLNL